MYFPLLAKVNCLLYPNLLPCQLSFTLLPALFSSSVLIVLDRDGPPPPAEPAGAPAAEGRGGGGEPVSSRRETTPVTTGSIATTRCYACSRSAHSSPVPATPKQPHLCRHGRAAATQEDTAQRRGSAFVPLLLVCYNSKQNYGVRLSELNSSTASSGTGSGHEQGN